ncbi:FecR family protein [Pedobacter xixiisoli]|uniref:FecR family protein n=1 Tax=Pedobacter xixiisoli TaxID=1476464 RepID=A0A285ZP97_9SPHI|nr:FecR domain-containing protein [Pedobacter xixiisoli]SOD11457.1 FecR family protein [Pedobacter xixiisoli]
MQAEKYLNYTVEDFLGDDDFIRYVKYQQAIDLQFWNDVLTQHEEKRTDFEQAKIQIRIILSAEPMAIPADLTDSLWDDIEMSIEKSKRRGRIVKLRNIWLSGVAACLACFAYGSWYFYSDITVTTKYGEQKVLVLPDGSKVRLNANSSISYARAFNWNTSRQVTIDGEAYFEVKHLNQNPDDIKTGERFVAEGKKLRVEVLGTTFNLKSRPNVNQVTLVSGKVKVKSIVTGEEKILKPGEFARLATNSKFVVNGTATVAPQLSWKENKLLMAQTRVGDIIAEFENLYGFKVILPDTSMADKRIDGTISTASEESMLFVLKNILNVNVRQEGNNIYLEKR